jgi:DnaJ homolog subfamily C member 19
MSFISHGKRQLRQGLVRQKARWSPLPEPFVDQQQQQQQPPRSTIGSGTSRYLHTMTHYNRSYQEDERKENPPQQLQKRHYHHSVASERVVAMIMGLGTLSALAYAGSSAAKSYEEWKASQPTPEELEEMKKAEEEQRQKSETEQAQAKAEEPKKQEDDQPRENFFKKFFDVGTKYYEGGFEDTMTKREAALILGVRESASPQKIKDAHRKLLILNHPDTGGSTYLSGKINEAKELLLKGRARV